MLCPPIVNAYWYALINEKDHLDDIGRLIGVLLNVIGYMIKKGRGFIEVNNPMVLRTF